MEWSHMSLAVLDHRWAKLIEVVPPTPHELCVLYIDDVRIFFNVESFELKVRSSPFGVDRDLQQLRIKTIKNVIVPFELYSQLVVRASDGHKFGVVKFFLQDDSIAYFFVTDSRVSYDFLSTQGEFIGSHSGSMYYCLSTVLEEFACSVERFALFERDEVVSGYKSLRKYA